MRLLKSLPLLTVARSIEKISRDSVKVTLMVKVSPSPPKLLLPAEEENSLLNKLRNVSTLSSLNLLETLIMNLPKSPKERDKLKDSLDNEYHSNDTKFYSSSLVKDIPFIYF